MKRRLGPRHRHMDVFKVAVSERVLRLGRVRMTYLFVTGPGMSMYGSRARFVYTKTWNTHTTSLPYGRWSNHSGNKAALQNQRYCMKQP